MPEQKTNFASIDVRNILVPVANPATAGALIRLACKLSEESKGRVLALYVVTPASENAEEVLEKLKAIVQEEAEGGTSLELITRTAPSAARGILDVAREQGATLMLLGFRGPTRREAELGSMIEGVARTTPCDLLVFRNPARSRVTLDDIEHVILPLDGSDNSHVAASLGLHLARLYGAQATAIFVQTDSEVSGSVGLDRIALALEDLPEARHIHRQVVQARDVVGGVLARADANDLIVLGFSERTPLDRWIYGDVTQRILSQAPCPVIVAKRSIRGEARAYERVWRRLLMRFSPTLTPYERSEVSRVAVETSTAGVNFLVLMFLSALLASFGLLQDSVAVIIGAMLVAPLMSPLMSFAVGLVQGKLSLMRNAGLTTLGGVAIGLLVAIVVGLAMPVNFSTSEMVVRGQPSLLDMGVALASGAAGAYAVARKDVPSALAGVAIAAALVPPLCTMGLALAFGDRSLASGSGLLFLTNIVSISLAGAGVFVWLGIQPGSHVRTRLGWIVTVAVLVALSVPLGSAFLNVVRTERQTDTARAILEEELPNSEVIEVRLISGTPLNITATVLSSSWVPATEVYRAQELLASELGREVQLTVTNWRAITPEQAEPSDTGIRP